MTTAERVEKMLSELEVDQVELAKLAGTSKAMVNHWLKEKVGSVGPEYAYNLEKATPYRARWIMIGEGPERADPTITSVSKLMEGMTPEQRETLYRIGASLGGG